MLLSSVLLLASLFIGPCLADDPPVRVTGINDYIATIGENLNYLDGYIRKFNPATATNEETIVFFLRLKLNVKEIYYSAFQILDDTLNAKDSVKLFIEYKDTKFYASEANLISSTVDGLANTLGSVLTGLKDKKDDLAAVGINNSPETLISWFNGVLTNTKNSTVELYSLITQLSPEPTKQHIKELAKTFADEFDTAISAYPISSQTPQNS